MLTLFCVPKPFRGHIKIIQNNALASWRRLHPDCEIIICGSEEGCGEAARTIGALHLEDIEYNEFGTPLLNSVFETVARHGRHRFLCYVNSDIILLEDFVRAVKRIRFRDFLMAGQRWDVDVRTPLDFESPHWSRLLGAEARTIGALHPPDGSDYFVFSRETGLAELPPFAVGRPGWDNWFLYRARILGVPVVDATEVTTVIHQNHDYAHVAQGREKSYNGPEGDRNAELLGGEERRFSLNDATHRLTRKALVPALLPRHILRRRQTLTMLSPRAHALKETMRGNFGAAKKILAGDRAD